ncbi:hypothetical protein LMG7974_01373 [Campylobacter majalis]|uniref:Fibronectin type-III domain-containing protein n=1 Tax=Campylobacter majalis TaxID=2790656 RepID=A0ABN7KC71_9BACT|nr:hypothetical protein LMG7974_01373 [Campylobacter majalis]
MLFQSPVRLSRLLQRSYPKGVTNLNATQGEPKKIVISWQPSITSDVVYYNVYRSASKFLPYAYLAKTNETSFEDLINSNGVTRYYKVTAVDIDELESLRQDEPVVGSTLDAPLSPEITALYDGGGINVSWSSVARAKSYTLTRSGGDKEMVFSGLNSNSYYDSDIQLGTKYSYKIVAVDEYGIESKPKNINISTK